MSLSGVLSVNEMAMKASTARLMNNVLDILGHEFGASHKIAALCCMHLWGVFSST